MYVKIKNGAVEKFPYGWLELMQDNPNTSFPEVPVDSVFAHFGVHPVTLLEIPSGFDSVTHDISPAEPKLINGAWVQGWNITASDDGVVAQRISDLAQSARSEREYRLQQTDWMALSDSLLAPEWVAYRQALRDITLQEGFPRSVIWPVKP